MAPKTVYLACAPEDGLFRTLFTTQWSRAGARVRFLDAPGKSVDAQAWEADVAARIRRADAVIALIGPNTQNSEDALWPIRCAAAEGKPLLGLWVDRDHQVKPAQMGSARCQGWTWENVGEFLDTL